VSFGLAVWKAAKPLSPHEAQAVYEKLCDEEIPEEIVACPEMKAFSAEVLARWPEDPDNPDSCPFEDPYGLPQFQILHLAWSRVPEVAPKVVALALRHGLICYDPQEGKVHQKRPWWKFWA
jgi:hypothetical protein